MQDGGPRQRFPDFISPRKTRAIPRRRKATSGKHVPCACAYGYEASINPIGAAVALARIAAGLKALDEAQRQGREMVRVKPAGKAVRHAR